MIRSPAVWYSAVWLFGCSVARLFTSLCLSRRPHTHLFLKAGCFLPKATFLLFKHGSPPTCHSARIPMLGARAEVWGAFTL